MVGVFVTSGEKLTAQEKPCSPSSERNQGAILAQLKEHLRPSDQYILEVGSGTGQHAVFFGQHLPDVIWQTSDVEDNHAGINMWLREYDLAHVLSPLVYQIGASQWPNCEADVVFSANTLHIISMRLVKHLIQDLGAHLNPGSRVFFYGPFKYQGQFTSESNAEFEQWLKDIDPARGIRDFEVIESLMKQQQFTLYQDIPMPANNQLLIFEKQS